MRVKVDYFMNYCQLKEGKSGLFYEALPVKEE